MRLTALLPALGLTCAATQAQAAVVELNCVDNDDQPGLIRNYVLNEETGRATLTIPRGSYPNVPAIFSTDQVRVVVAQDDASTLEYVVDRTTLKDKLVVTVAGQAPEEMHRGQCKIAQRAKRKF